jgi:ATP-dependent DNA helicase RecG
VDEQHRFGVEERAQLTAKGEGEPHLLLMTATPIPRTIAQLLYADVASSELRALPAGRQPIRTAIRSGAELGRLWSFVTAEAAAGRGTFVVVPRIGETEPGEEPIGETAGDALEAAGEVGVLEQAERIAIAAPSLKIGVVHGRQPTAMRTDVMDRFTRGDLDVIVGTTVVEVGVDVPRASVMVIMDADRFGLATLHQLRGRVGRGGSEGWCVLVSDSQDEVARARLEAIERTRDGFLLAERDVELRGEGDVLGTEQSGLPPLRVAALSRAEDRALAVVARAEAERMLDPMGRPTSTSRPLVASYLRGWPTAVLVSGKD